MKQGSHRSKVNRTHRINFPFVVIDRESNEVALIDRLSGWALVESITLSVVP